MVYFFKDYEFAAKYPFSSKAKEIMRERMVEVDEVIAEAGFNRLSSALTGGIKRKLFVHEQDAVDEIMAYATARMLLSYMRNNYLTNKYAIAEAKRTSAYLENEEEDSLLILAKDLGLDSFSENEGTLTVDIVHYLTFAPKDVHYKLIGREISNGRVVINTHERIRLIEEAVKKYAEKLPAAQALPPVIKKYAEKLQALLPKIEPQKLSFKQGENPPCIEALLEMFRKHENIGHTGRWLLAVYLINKGMKTQDMLAIFSNAPDYNERIATYQIEHARKRGYKMPKCSSLVGYGYCVANCGIKNPMGWKRRKGA